MTFIVAEIGVNWDGDFDTLKKMVYFSKKVDCNAVKFQAYNLDMIKNHPQKDRLIKSTISKENIELVDSICKKNNIEWFCTPMYDEAVDLLDPFVKRYKIREFDARILLQNKTNKMLDKIFQTKKEVIASSEKTPIKSSFYKKINWLYCIPKYPCSLSDLNFTNLKDFNGYSNHCPDIIAPLKASILGSHIIEIHITESKSKNFLDNPVSFDFEELNLLTQYIRRSEKIIT